LVLLVLLIVAAALGLTMLFRRNTNAPLFLFNVFADAALGVVAGLGSRMVFRRRNWVLRLVTAVVLCVLGLLILGQLTSGISGVGPVRFQAVTVDWLQRLGLALRPVLPIGIRVDWLQELADILITVSVSLLALRAWNGPNGASAPAGTGSRRGKRPEAEAPAPSDLPAASMPAYSASQPQRAQSTSNAPAVHRSPLGLPPALSLMGSPARKSVRGGARGLGLPPALAGRSRRPARVARKSAAKLTVSRPARPAPGRVQPRKRIRPRTAVVRPSRATGRVRGARNLLRHRRAVRLAAYEEHRCPYCLEPVKRGDPRGTVECPICHTLHHKDCWDVTGSCQIPHLTS